MITKIQQYIGGGLVLLGLVAGAAVVSANPSPEQVAALDAAVTMIGTAVDASPDITEDERAALQGQVAVLDSVVQSLAVTTTQSSTSTSTVAMPPLSDAERRAAEIRYIRAAYNHRSQQVVTSVQYASSTTSFVYTYPELAQLPTFTFQFPQMRLKVIESLATQLQLPPAVIAEKVLFTARNPKRDSVYLIQKNSELADEVAEGIGFYSIINQIDITGSHDGGEAIILHTDQQEKVVLRVIQNKERTGDEWSRFRPGTYNFSLLVYLTDGMSLRRIPGTDDTSDGIITEIVEHEASEAEFVRFMNNTFGSSALLQPIQNFPQKLLRFFTENNTVAYVSENFVHTKTSQAVRDATTKCFVEEDRDVLLAFVSDIVAGMKVQTLPLEDIVRVVPNTYERERSNEVVCVGSKDYF